MPTYVQLYHLDLRPLKDAQEEWSAAAKKLKTVRSSYRTSVKRNFARAEWTSSGSGPARAEAQMNSAFDRLGDAVAQAEANAEILGDARRELRAQQRELLRLADEEAPQLGLFVQKDGTVVARNAVDDHPAAHNDPDAEGARRRERERIERLSADLSRVLRRAAEIDGATAWALRYNAGESKVRHNDVVVSDLDDARQHIKGEERFVDAEKYIFEEMKRNAQSDDVKGIRHLLRDSTWYDNALGRDVGAENSAAMAAWFVKVAPGQDWDHKPKLAERYDLESADDYYFKDPDQDKEVYYDIYSNIHYGYVGRAAGFDRDTLVDGASAAEPALVGEDDAGDQITMRIGMDLYDRYGDDMTQEQLHEGIEQAMREMEREQAKGEDVPQIRDAD